MSGKYLHSNVLLSIRCMKQEKIKETENYYKTTMDNKQPSNLVNIYRFLVQIKF